MTEECEFETCKLTGREVVIYGHHHILCEEHFKETMEYLDKERNQE